MTTQPQSRFFTIPSIPSVLWGLFLCSVLVGSIGPMATAQPTQRSTANAPSTENAETASELAERLASPIDVERFQALRQVVSQANFSPEVDLTPTVPALTTIYKDAPNERNRLVAVVALSAISTEAGLRQVRQRFLRDPSLMVQYVSLHALIDHYGPGVFAGNPEALILAENVLARKQEARRLAQMQQAVPSLATQR